MGNKPHLHPNQKPRRDSRTVRLFVVVLVIAIFGLALYLSATGHILIGRR